MTLAAIACEKEKGNGSDIYILDKVAESAASANDDGTYILDLTLEGSGYVVRMCVKGTELTLAEGAYKVGTDGCEVSFNDGYVNRNVSGGSIDISAANDTYTILISVTSRNTEYKFKYEGPVTFSRMQGRVVRNCSVSSSAMGRTMNYSIYLPADYSDGEVFPVLYLLHGYGDENNAWIDKGNLPKIAQEYEEKGGKPMIVVCPDALTTFYYDSPQTMFKKYFFEELVPAIEMTYKVRRDRYSRAVAGLSMGGYGTLYYGLGEPDKFCYAYACSAAIEMAGMPSIYSLARNADPTSLPGITLEMGTEDWVTGNGEEFHNIMNEEGIKHEYIARTGVHDWKFWQECLPKILKRCGETFKD